MQQQFRKYSDRTGRFLLAWLLLPAFAMAAPPPGDDGGLVVRVTGASDEVRENILARLPAYRPRCDASGDEVDKFMIAARPKIDSAIRAMGYYSASSSSRVDRPAGCWELRVTVKQGKPVRVSGQQVSITGAGRGDPALKSILATSPYAKGEIFRHDKYEAFKSRLEQAANSRGYFDARFEQREILVNPDTRNAEVRLKLATGERYRFGRISVRQPVLAPDVMRKYILLREGEPFSTAVLIRQQQLIQGSGYYAEVRVTALYGEARNGSVPVEISATPLKKHAYEARVGYGTDTGFRIGFDYERRWVNSRGAKLDASIGVSQKLVFGDINYIVPSRSRLNESMRYKLGWRREYGDDVRSKTIELGAEYRRKRPSGWEQALFLRYVDDITQAAGEPELDSHFLIGGIRVRKVVADNKLYPRKGWLLRTELQGAWKGIASSSSFLQASVHAKLIRPAGKGRLIARGDIGYTRIGNLSKLPKQLRFFAGGDDSVRGYGYESLGERNAKGAVIGGKHLLAASLEYEHPIRDGWSLALFVDTGNAFNDWNSIDLKTGVGFGARWRSPIGPVRADIAFPTDDFGDPRLHFSIGPDL